MTTTIGYPFDPDHQALATQKERFVWMMFMGIVFFLLYGVSNHMAGLYAPHPSLYLPWEMDIPFISHFIIPYMSSDIMFVVAFLFPYTRWELRVLSARVLYIVALSSLIFIAYPLSFGFTRPTITDYSFLFSLLKADLPYNQLPSLHISFAIVLWASMRNHFKSLIVKYMVALWFVLIALSTLLVYQHHFIDLPTGALMGLSAIYLINKNSFITTRFTTPRHIKMGLYYLTGSVVLIVLAFIFPSFWILFLWFFISLFSISVIYAFGLNTLLAGKDAKANIYQKILFAPYFIGNYISWRYYKRGLNLIDEVTDGVYIGRQPDFREYKHIGNISHIINLATEQQLHHFSANQTRLAFLDQTIQPPELLHDGVLLIEANKENGVFVHCALGLSRSVLQISSWLIYNGYTIDEAQEFMRRARPNHSKSPYMRITLEIYADYISKHANQTKPPIKKSL